MAQFADAAAPGAIPRFVSAAAAGVRHEYKEGPTEFAKTATSLSREGAFVVGGGVAALDCDGDDLLDLFLAGGAGPAALYRNITDPGFGLNGVAPIAFEAAAPTAEALGVQDDLTRGVTGAYAFFWDPDEHPDLFLLRFGRNLLLRGLGDCRFEDASAGANLPQTPDWSAAFAAHWTEGAALPLLAVGAYVDRERPLDRTGNCPPGYLLAPDTADPTRYQAPKLIEPAGCALSIMFVDWSGAGNVALRVSNDRQYADPDVGEQLYRLGGTAGEPSLSLFEEADGWAPTTIWGMGLAAGDLDEDGAPEIAATSMADNRLEKLAAGAAGAPRYDNIAFDLAAHNNRPYVGDDLRPSTSWHAAFEDFNNDGVLDLWIVKGNVSAMPEFAAFDPDSLLLGQRDAATGAPLPFREVGFEAGVALPGRGRGGAAVDLNNDGLLDLVVSHYDGPVRVLQAIPTGASDAGSLSVMLLQDGANRGAVGAMAAVEFADGRRITRHVRVGGGHAGGSAAPLHFGLGPEQSARLRVTWPDGAQSAWRTVAAGDRITVRRTVMKFGG